MSAIIPTAYIPGEVRKYLLADEEFIRLLHGGAVTCREVPDPLTKPHVTVKAVGHQGGDPRLHRVLIQITPWVPRPDVSRIPEDPDITAWNLATRAGELLARAKNIIVDDTHAWSAHWVDGPIQLEDKNRGLDRIIYYAPVRIGVHLRRHTI